MKSNIQEVIMKHPDCPWVFIPVICLAIIVSACGPKTEPAFDVADMDLSVRAGDNFYQFANGTWLKKNPIPDEYSRYGVFEYLMEQNYKDLKALLQEVAGNKNAEEGSLARKIGDFYRLGMNAKRLESDGLEPLQDELTTIAGIRNMQEVQALVARYQTFGISPLFHIFASSDEKNSEMNIAHLMQGGLGLPDRDYYTKTDSHSDEIRKAYVKHVAKMLELAGDDPETASGAAERIMKLETRLANASMTLLERRDPHKTYNKMSVRKLASISPHFKWDNYFKDIGLDDPGHVNVRQPEFFREISAMFRDVRLDDWKLYLKWNLINRSAEFLNEDFVNQDFEFYGKTLSGTEALQERWKRVLQTTNRALGEAVGQLYVEKHFPPEAKERMMELVINLKAALKTRIQNANWMSDATKEKALEKLNVMTFKIGYPDKWRDYTGLEVRDDAYVLNVIRGNQFEFRRDINKVNKPVDRDEWFMYPQTVNAYYNPNQNEIVFPAAILQPPFFNMDADDAVNYGAIGYVIGHEMTHGFDDQGRYYDASGNLNDWWTEEDAKEFKARAQMLVDQFNRYMVMDSLHLDGKLTLGENIADLGGLNVAFTALQKSMEGKPRPEPIDGFTPEQRFFLGMAQVWRNNIRDEALMRRLREDVHSPGEFRVNGPVVNMPQFQAAFDVKPGDALYLPEEKQARIW